MFVGLHKSLPKNPLREHGNTQNKCEPLMNHLKPSLAMRDYEKISSKVLGTECQGEWVDEEHLKMFYPKIRTLKECSMKKIHRSATKGQSILVGHVLSHSQPL